MISPDYPEYRAASSRRVRILIIFLIASAVLSLITIGLNRYSDLSFSEAFETLLDHLTGSPSSLGNDDFVIWDRMVPRAIMAVCVGCVLGLGGAVMQIVLQNPLADPYNTGISSGAGVGATLFLVMGVSIVPGLSAYSSMVVNSFLFSLIPVALIILISQFKRMSPSQMILIGIGVMFYFSATNTIMMLMADPSDLKGAYFWTMGNLGNAEWGHILLVVSVTVSGSLLLLSLHRRLGILSAGDNYAVSVGIDPTKLRRLVLVITSLMVAAVVCFSGTIGFVGIIAPHLARMTLGSDTRHLLPASMILGTAIMLLADSAAKLLIVPVGVITSIIGAPLFLVILIKMKRNAWT